MREPTLTITVEGPVSEGGKVRVSDLIQELQFATRAVRKLDAEISGQPSGSFYYRVRSASYASPLTITLEAQPFKPDVDLRNEVTDRFISLVEGLSKGKVPTRVNPALLADIKRLTATVGESLSSVRLGSDGKEVTLDQKLSAQIDVALAPEETWAGEMRGMLEYINIHEEKNVFRVYPEIGPPHLNCNFPPELKTQAIKAVGRYVEVSGIFRYKAIADYPHEVDVHRLRVLRDEAKLPTLMSLRGIAPKATGTLSSDEFVRNLRDGREEANDILG